MSCIYGWRSDDALNQWWSKSNTSSLDEYKSDQIQSVARIFHLSLFICSHLEGRVKTSKRSEGWVFNFETKVLLTSSRAQSVVCVFKLCSHQLFLSVNTLICIPTNACVWSVPATAQAIPRKFIFQKEQWNANDIYWQISVGKVFQRLPSSGCQRGFAVSGTFPLGAAPLLDIELTLCWFVLSPFSSPLFSLLPL